MDYHIKLVRLPPITNQQRVLRLIFASMEVIEVTVLRHLMSNVSYGRYRGVNTKAMGLRGHVSYSSYITRPRNMQLVEREALRSFVPYRGIEASNNV
jgi:hypothetical protein